MTAPLDDDQFRTLVQLVYQRSGIRLRDRKRTTLNQRVAARMAATDTETTQQYCEHIASPRGRTELWALIESLTTGETSFYRTQNHFDWMKNEFLPQMRAAYGQSDRKSSLRIWSAACSVGAEAYTAAMLVDRWRGMTENPKCEILGTDISESVLEQARLGQFKSRLVDNVPPKDLERYFDAKTVHNGRFAAEVFEIKPRIRRMVTFRRHNLIDPPPRKDFDLVLLRNVLIYFDAESKQQTLRRIGDSIASGGYLIVGPSEGIFGLDTPLTKLSTFLYKKP